MKDEREIRVSHLADLKLRSDPGKPPAIVGYAAVFNQPSDDLGGFREIVRPGAFKKTIQESDVRALWNHDNSQFPLGRSKSGTLTMAEDEVGLRVEIYPPDTQVGRDCITSIKRGDVDGMSFGFSAIRDTWDNSDPDNVMRFLDECRLYDVSPVTFPAYPQTSLSVRSKIESLAKTTEPPVEHSAGGPAKSHQWREAQMRKIKLVELDSLNMNKGA